MEKLTVTPAPAADAAGAAILPVLREKLSKNFFTNMKSWQNDFFSRDRTMWSVPKPQEILSRIECNIDNYSSNYITLVGTILIVTILSQPYFLFTLVFLAFAWGYVYSVQKLVVKGREISQREKLLGMCAVTALLLVVFAGTALFAVIGISSVAVLGHAMLHTPNYGSIFEGSAPPATSV
eukprot:GILI01021576.1.p1 GENE.GILI01021576.1~~GILI01021576.1.p1  ORF type:complete len:209 (-),score=63.07 GILI01021576.1:509-1048(-)